MIRYHARWVLPVAQGPLRDATVITNGSTIEWVGARGHAPPANPDDLDVELGDAALLPGLVNAHIHLDLAPFAGLTDERAFFPWVRAIAIGSAEALGEADRLVATTWSAIDQLEHGVTTLADTSPSRAAFDAMRAIGVRGIAFLEVFGPDPRQADASLTELRTRVEAARAAETALVRVGVSPHAPYSVSDELFRAVADYAAVETLPIAVHVAESADESDLVAHGRGPFADFLLGRRIQVAPRAASPVALLERQRVLRERPLCIHAVQVHGDDVLRIADNGARVAHCPRSNRWFNHGDAPLSDFRRRSVDVGIGTDSAASNNDLRVLGEACDASDETLGARDRLALATVGGARALGLVDGTGTLANGAAADLTVFRIADVTDADRDPEAWVLAHCENARADLVVVAGEPRVRAGRALARETTLDEDFAAVCRRVRSWSAAAGWRSS